MPDASPDFGAQLRQAREQRGISLRDIADRTKISVLVLEALERNDVSRLPGGIFTRAFVRAYASEVGLDPDDTVRRFLARFPDESHEEVPRRYEANPDHIEVDESPTFGRALRAVAWSLPLLVGIAYFGFGGRLPFWPGRAAQPAAKPAQQSQAAAPVAKAPAPGGSPQDQAGTEARAEQPGTVPNVTAEAVQPAAGGPGTSQSETSQVSPATAIVPPAGGATPAAVPPAAGAGASETPPEGTFHLTLSPREDCWVSIRRNGASVYSGLMRTGERKDLRLQGPVSLTVGNAGVFGFLINDQQGRSLGGPGQVVTVQLSAENLKTFLQPR